MRGDSAYGNRAVIRVCRRYGAVFSLVLTGNPAVQRAIDAISEDAWTPVQFPGAVRDPDTGAWISDAEVAETTYTMAESGTGITARLIARRVKDANQPADGLFPIWRYHPFFTNSTEPPHRRRYHPPPPRDHRNNLRRSHRRTPGPHPFWALRRQLCVGDLRGHRA